MLQVQFIKDNQKKVLEGLAKRNFANANTIIDTVLKADENRRKTQVLLDNTLAELNTLSKEIGLLFKSGQTQKAAIVKEKTSLLKEHSKALTDQLNTISKELTDLLYQIPNIPHASVASGKSEEDNEEIFKEGAIPDLHKGSLPHWELVKKYDIVDFELGTKITGAGFPVYKGKGAKLQRALINYFLDKNTSAGYTEFQVPHLVNSDSAFATGQLPDKDGQMYHVDEDNFYLIPTAEVPLTNIYRDKILSSDEIPVLLTGYTPCFKREAGSYGAEVRGLNRLHQFDKVEIVRLEHPDNSSQALVNMKQHVKEILGELEIDFRILNLCAGDLGFTSSITYDFEIFSKGQKKWLEISSVSNFKSYQSNRLNLKFKNKEGKNEFLHTLNGSSLALPRVIAGLIENNQTNEGIQVPKVLVPYTGFDLIN